MSALRSDAARSRARILEVAKLENPDDLRFNHIAREAGVGVGTVYRHFPSAHALKEALTAETLAAMVQLSRDAAQEVDAAVALRAFVSAALQLQLEDGGLQAVLLSPDDEDSSVREMKHEIFATFTNVFNRARESGAVRRDVTVEQIEHLICGIEHAVRLGDAEHREVFLDILLTGLRS
ncbi:TetR/AcrR family transcriptional regulator [Paramicrobacterium chengjingii]|uniref:TetR family transcriptional regulator n=1 Tax=Paramicrobacterium chengjingii TaxID=2769067 RepID=A0ABX6YIN3_9MICO|nr:TetR family transcriptional regulator [Microbacterium chengjingii]QPZ38662.1 TetR family transcriptional regulator [Microbacterium chengjingii]